MTIQAAAGLSSARQAALDSLQQASHGQSLCTLRGEKVEAVKYFEGRVVALTQLLRSPDQTELSHVAEELADSWQHDLVERAAADPGWASYLAGLLDACREVSQ